MSKDLNLKIKADSKNAEKGINKISSELNKISKSSTVNSVAKLGLAFNGVKSSVQLVTKAIKAVNETIKETTELYKKQATAEKQLEVAVKNNPYLSSSAVNDLRNYASQLQSISTIGDEELIPMMAQLATAGRTQAEIQDIMAAALDVSASGMMSLDSAVTSLNKTYSGSVGLLGNQISELKNLTAEQLKNGEAVKIIGEKFKGMAEETAKATGSSEQLKNAVGDFKEELGAGFEKGLAPMRRFFTNLIQGWTDAAKRKREYNEAKADIEEEGGLENAEIKTVQALIAGEEQLVKQAQTRVFTAESMLKMNDAQLRRAGTTRKNQETFLEQAKHELELREKNVEEYKKQLEVLEEIDRKEKAIVARQEEKASADAKAQKAIDAYNKTVADALQNIELRKKLGEQITEEAEAQEMLNVKTNAYIKMIKDAEGTISGLKGWAKDEADRIASEAAALYGSKNGGVNEADPFAKNKELIAAWETNRKDTLKLQKQMLQDYMDYLNNKGDLTDDEIALKNRLKEAMDNIDKAILQQLRKTIAEITEMINEYLTEFASISNDMTSLIRKNNEAETGNKMSELDKQYADGLISYEDYCDKKEQIDKEAAKKEYKLKMWEWTTSLLTATANIAQGVSKAIAQGGLAGIISGALVTAAGAVQLATITANKPKPAFAQGGIVPGTSYNGDRVQANVNSGEMILNAAQQKQLWEVANGRSANGAILNMPITIENNASNTVNAKTRMTANGLKIVIDEIVNASMASGTYNDSMQKANNIMNGVSLL